MSTRRPVLLCAGALLLATSLVADTLSLAVGDPSYIAGRIGGETRGRLLLRTAIPDDILNARIDFARLVIPSPDLPDTHAAMTIEARRITSAWNEGGVSWTSPWRTPGGDYDTTRLARCTFKPGRANPVFLNVTDFVQEWQANGGNFGLILKRTGFEGGGFESEATALREALRSARLKLWYVHVQR